MYYLRTCELTFFFLIELLLLLRSCFIEIMFPQAYYNKWKLMELNYISLW